MGSASCLSVGCLFRVWGLLPLSLPLFALPRHLPLSLCLPLCLSELGQQCGGELPFRTSQQVPTHHPFKKILGVTYFDEPNSTQTISAPGGQLSRTRHTSTILGLLGLFGMSEVSKDMDFFGQNLKTKALVTSPSSAVPKKVWGDRGDVTMKMQPAMYEPYFHLCEIAELVDTTWFVRVPERFTLR